MSLVLTLRINRFSAFITSWPTVWRENEMKCVDNVFRNCLCGSGKYDGEILQLAWYILLCLGCWNAVFCDFWDENISHHYKTLRIIIRSLQAMSILQEDRFLYNCLLKIFKVCGRIFICIFCLRQEFVSKQWLPTDNITIVLFNVYEIIWCCRCMIN